MDFVFWLLSYVVPFLVVLTIIVFVHEMGHYLVARWNGIAIQAFSIGFGPELVGFNDRRGTRWKLSAIPLGGYVRFVGDMNAASMPDEDFIERAGPELSRQLFVNKNVWQRIAVVVAGPVANIIFTLLVLYALLLGYGRYTIPAVLDAVPVESVAGQAGLAEGDRIVSVDGYEVRGFEDFQRLIATAPERQVSITFERSGQTKTVTAVPQAVTTTDRFGNSHRIGRLGVTKNIEQSEVVLYRPNPIEAIGMTFEEVRFIVDRTVAFLGDFFVGRGDVEQLGGPVKVAKVSGEVASLGVVALINLMALLSLNIGIFNLLPIPVLDGGHLLYYLAEAARGKPLSQRVQDIGNRFGLAVVFSLMIFTTFNDTILSYIRSLG
ncbi:MULTISPECIES: RIP metalloprotease RseP [unclassified Devosia]|uniref:RIP metalloprotease RseP n=1 Tax=unclassified Devosia TaxID=196773 RepID=UPI00086B4381|nr:MULTISPECIES: RIP metalloprotease RseP [unclassified Devosia]MBN9361607.1 RIP metalloprotease RseP [Devosia sp.]ODS91761.1 MAG: RIP metalloprotease RseP [Devosia sp. SCN 66-27]OJX26656.1 MAG: RIP metalloprotease RseP [Devosia sp. 66-14]